MLWLELWKASLKFRCSVNYWTQLPRAHRALSNAWLAVAGNTADRGGQGCLSDWWHGSVRAVPAITTGMPQKGAEGEAEQLVHVGHAPSTAKITCLAGPAQDFQSWKGHWTTHFPTVLTRGHTSKSQYCFIFPEEEIQGVFQVTQDY